MKVSTKTTLLRSVFVLGALHLSSAGRVFSQDVAETILHNFSDVDGLNPLYGVIQGADGNLYGTAVIGGSDDYGTAFKITSQGQFTSLHNFGNSADGGKPSGLVQGSDGNFYGTTVFGGSGSGCQSDGGCGTVFELTPAGVLTTIHNFSSEEGSSSSSGLIFGADGNLYGSAALGGKYGFGTVFRATLNGDITVLYNFTGSDDGSNPSSPLIQGSDGNLYGTTPGSETGPGTVFKLTSSGTLTTLYSYANPDGGHYPISGLIEGSDGALYGTTLGQGPEGYDDGTVFKITTAGKLTTLYTFTGGADGGAPFAALFLAGDGNFYGSTIAGGNLTVCATPEFPGCGVIFKVTAAGVVTPLSSLPDTIDGPTGTFVQGADGILYGTTQITSNVIYNVSFSSALPAPVQLSLSPSSIYEGASTTLSWKVLNAYSATIQQCNASIQGGTARAGIWSGPQIGTLSNGVFSGSSQISPTSAGTYTYALTCGGTESGFATLTVGVPPPLKITTTSLPAGIIGSAYSSTLNATGGVPPYIWSLTSGELPLGLSIGPSSGAISGTPTAAGSDGFNVQVEDSASPPSVASASLTLTVNAAQPEINVSPSIMKLASPGASGTSTVTVSAFSNNSIAFSCSGLPAGAYCNFGTLSGSGSAGTASLQITTTSQSVTNSASSDPSPTHQMLATLLPGVLVILAIGVGTRRGHRWPPLKLFLVPLVLGMSCTITACGGGNGQSRGGTPAGTRTVTVTATAGSQTAAATFTLTVE